MNKLRFFKVNQCLIPALVFLFSVQNAFIAFADDQDAWSRQVEYEEKSDQYKKVFSAIASEDDESLLELVKSPKTLDRVKGFGPTLVLRWLTAERYTPWQLKMIETLIDKHKANADDPIVQRNIMAHENYRAIPVILRTTKDPDLFLRLVSNQENVEKYRKIFNIIEEAGFDYSKNHAGRVVLDDLLKKAVSMGYFDVIEYLLEKGADPEKALLVAVKWTRNYEVVDFLVHEYKKRISQEIFIETAKIANSKDDQTMLALLRAGRASLGKIRKLEPHQAVASIGFSKDKLRVLQDWKINDSFNEDVAVNYSDIVNITGDMLSPDAALSLFIGGKVSSYAKDLTPLISLFNKVPNWVFQREHIGEFSFFPTYFKGSREKLIHLVSLLLGDRYIDPDIILDVVSKSVQWSRVADDVFMNMIQEGHITPFRLMNSGVNNKNDKHLFIAMDYGATVADIDPSSFEINTFEYLTHLKKRFRGKMVKVHCDNAELFDRMSLHHGSNFALKFHNTLCLSEHSPSKHVYPAYEWLVKAVILKRHETVQWENQGYHEYSQAYLSNIKDLPAMIPEDESDLAGKLMRHMKCVPDLTETCAGVEGHLRSRIAKSKLVKSVLTMSEKELAKHSGVIYVYPYIEDGQVGVYKPKEHSIHLNTMHLEDDSENYFRTLLHELTHMAMDGAFPGNGMKPYSASNKVDCGAFFWAAGRTAEQYAITLRGNMKLPDFLTNSAGKDGFCSKNSESNACMPSKKELAKDFCPTNGNMDITDSLLMFDAIGREDEMTGFSESEYKVAKELARFSLNYKNQDKASEFIATYVSYLDIIKQSTVLRDVFAPMAEFSSKHLRPALNK